MMTIMLLAGCLSADNPQIRIYQGGSDPSAAQAVDSRFFVVGDDEHNTLKLYSMEDSPIPVFSLDVSGFLRIDPEHPEADIEAAARIGDCIYWITSHGRNKDGKIRPSRYRLFATQIKQVSLPNDPNGPPQIAPFGRPCSTLITDMLKCPHLNELHLKNVTRIEDKLSKKERELLAPKEKGLNIEGLAAGPDGQSLWIALRNPLHADNLGKRKAIIVPLLNPQQVIEQGKSAQFGAPILLDLGGRGVRSIDYLDDPNEYLIAAGSTDSKADFAVFRYRPGDNDIAEMKVGFPPNFNPESMFLVPGRNTICFISDDGTIEKEVQNPEDCMEGQLLTNGLCPNKFLVDVDKRTFRIFLFPPPGVQ